MKLTQSSGKSRLKAQVILENYSQTWRLSKIEGDQHEKALHLIRNRLSY
jgi:hypothetical protein